MEKTKLVLITLAVATFTVSLFVEGCNRQEQALRARAGWPTSSPTVAASGDSSAAQTRQQPYDLQFIDSMTAHHEQGVQMAQLAADKAQHAELKEMARKMVNDQQQEIEQMRAWRGQWFANQPQTAGGLEHQTQQGGQALQAQATPGVTSSGQSDLNRLQAATGNDFDLIFLEAMISHHQSGIQMSQDALARAERQEVKQLAQKINEEQQREIATMNEWKKAWGNELGKSPR